MGKMSKRYGNVFENSSSSAKKAKLHITVKTSEQVAREKIPSAPKTNEDVWGDDFAEEEMVEIDFIASQSTLRPSDEQVKPSTSKAEFKVHEIVRSESLDSGPSKVCDRLSKNVPKPSTFQPKVGSRLSRVQFSTADTRNNVQQLSSVQLSQKLGSSEFEKEFKVDENTMIFEEFKNKLLYANNHNSTFCSQIEDSRSKELEKLKLENEKLHDRFLTKEGETVFLRNQLQQTQLRADAERTEKMRFIEEQESRHRTEINAVSKEKEHLKTEIQLQALQLGNLMERCKLLESGSVKLTEPHTVNMETPNRSRFNTTIARSSTAVKTIKVSETSVQTGTYDKTCYSLKTQMKSFPLRHLPRSIFEPSLPEKSVVDIQIVEKIGKRNLPILQDEDEFRIFENPDLVKPVITTIDDRRLSVEFLLPDVAEIMNKTEPEINSNDMIPVINKLISTARELVLNSTIVLQTISNAMKNDDIRDMNDVYFSDFYEMSVDYSRSVCDARVWYDKERGIEARRVLGVLSYVASVSTYLCEYVAGKTPLLLNNDLYYEHYNRQMSSYNAWSKKGCQFEMLDMFQQFVTVIGLVRRSHQFSGLITAIVDILCNVENKVGFCSRGLDSIFDIFKEIVFSRPLAHCYIKMTNILMVFGRHVIFTQKLCKASREMAVALWRDVLHFTPDACALEVYIAQMEHSQLDFVATISIAHALVTFVHSSLVMNNAPRMIEAQSSCNCFTKLLRLTITLLYNCSAMHLDMTETVRKKCNRSSDAKDQANNTATAQTANAVSTKATHQNGKDYSERTKRVVHSNWLNCDENFKLIIKNMQFRTLKKGIRFLCHQATQDPDFIIRLSDIEESFHLFMENISSFKGLVLNENEQEALSLIKSTFVFDRATPSESPSQKSHQFSSFKADFDGNLRPRSGNRSRGDRNSSNSRSSVQIYKQML